MQRLLFISLLSVLVACLAFAPIDSAIISQGHLASNTEPIQIQHLEGGVVAAVYVKEGDYVSPGDDLLRISSPQTEALYKELRKQKNEIKYQEEQTEAELAQFRSSSQNIRHLQAWSQHKQQMRHSELEAAKARLNALIEQRSQQKLLIQVLKKKQTLIQKKRQDVEDLVLEGHLATERLTAALISETELELELQNHLMQLSQLRHKIQEAEKEAQALFHRHITAIYAEKKEWQGQRKQLNLQFKPLERSLSNRSIKSPIAGHVFKLNAHHPGDIIPQASPIMTIVPNQPRLKVYSTIRSKDRDQIQLNQDASIQLLAFPSYSKSSKRKAKITHISADIDLDPDYKEPVYHIHLALEPVAENSKKSRQNMLLGMPVQVSIKTGSRTVLGYLFSPLLQASQRAFKEQ